MLKILLENDRKHFLYMAKKQGLKEGIEQGELIDKHNVLILFLN